jgi:hypothetical protein
MNTIQTDRSNLGKHIFSCLTFQDQEIDVMQYKSLGSLSSCSLYLSDIQVSAILIKLQTLTKVDGLLL